MKKFIPIVLIGLLLAGCATKRYGRQSDLSDYESKTLTSSQLTMEFEKALSARQDIVDTDFDGRDVLAIMGDLGIGNALERDSALGSVDKRIEDILDTKVNRGMILTSRERGELERLENEELDSDQKPRRTRRTVNQ